MTSELPLTVDAVIQRMKQIDATLDARDGVACFNRMYLEVTELVAQNITEGFFQDAAFIERMDVIFAGLYFRSVDAAIAKRPVNPAWKPLFEARDDEMLWPIQFALAGMNAHINHDLALSVIATCKERGTTPETPPVHADYLRVNALLAKAEAEVRASFEPKLVHLATQEAETLKHIVGSFGIDRARDAAWINAQLLWPNRNNPVLYDAATTVLALNVGFAGKLLLTPVIPPID
ncbi:DUF5995 family protein [Streptomyces sp. NPDC037389]|uniref:DUF5995 family protein n=1 Tax=Streptomyces sp. NPDC037389 TaxID=3155369 RepID=UPI0033F8994A